MKVQYSQALLDIAQNWPTYEDFLTDNEGNSWPCVRCEQCDNAILQDPGTLGGTAYHLLTHHGYRMDGRHETEQEIAAQAAAERGEMNDYHRP